MPIFVFVAGIAMPPSFGVVCLDCDHKPVFRKPSSILTAKKPQKRKRRSALSPSRAKKKYYKYVLRAAKRYDIEPILLEAVIHTESNWRVDAKSSVGAYGLMQLMPATAKRFKVKNIKDPRQNIMGGARYLRYLLTLFDENLTLAIAAYNAGEGRVLKDRDIPNIRQTQGYVEKVLRRYDSQSI